MDTKLEPDGSDLVRRLSVLEPVPYAKKRRASSIKPLQPRKSKDVSLFAVKASIGVEVAKMEGHPLDYAIQLEGCRNMGTYASNGSLDVLVSRPHGIELVIEAMKTFSDKYELQLAAIESLSKLASGNNAEACCMYIYKNSGLRVILNALQNYRNDTKLQFQALKCLYAMSTCEDILNAVGTEKMANIVDDGLKQNIKSAAVLQTACLILANACTDEKTACHVLEKQILGNILNHLVNQERKPELLDAVCRLIGSLAFHEQICEALPSGRCLKAVIKALDLAPDNVELAESASWASACLTKLDKNKESFVTSGGHVKLSLTMARFQKVPPVQEYGCWTISNISETENSDVKAKVISVDTADLLVEAMSRYPENEEIQEQAIFSLAQFLEEQDIQIHLYQKEGIRSVIIAMNMFPDNQEIQEQGCRVLGNLAVTELVRTAVAQNGGICSVVAAMERFPESEQLLEYGCHALANLAAEVEENKNFIAEEEGIAAILSSMDKHQSNRPLQISGCRALCNLAGNELISLKILQDGGLYTLLTTMTNFKEDELLKDLSFNIITILADTMEATKNALGQKRNINAIIHMIQSKDADISQKSLCCKLLHIYAYEEENHDFFVERGVVAEVVRTMKENLDTKEIQEYGCKLLALLSYGKGKNCVINENGIDMIFVTMETFQDNLQLQLVCSGALSYLAREDVDKSRVDNHLWMKALIRNMKKFSNNREMQVVGCITIPALVSEEIQNTVTENGGLIDLVVAAMKKFSKSEDLALYGCNTLCSLAINDKHRQVMVSKNIQNVVINLMRQHPSVTDIQLVGCQTLQRLSQRDSENYYEASGDCIKVLEDILNQFQDYERVYKVANAFLQLIPVKDTT